MRAGRSGKVREERQGRGRGDDWLSGLDGWLAGWINGWARVRGKWGR